MGRITLLPYMSVQDPLQTSPVGGAANSSSSQNQERVHHGRLICSDLVPALHIKPTICCLLESLCVPERATKVEFFNRNFLACCQKARQESIKLLRQISSLD